MSTVRRFLPLILASLLAAGALAAEPLRVVFLVHGWNGSVESFGGLPPLLTGACPGAWPAGHFQVVPIAFRSPHRDATLPEQAALCGDQILTAYQDLITQFPGRPLESYFISHSMGGLIVRQLFLDHRNDTNGMGDIFRHMKVAILVAPPSQGSDEVRFAVHQVEKSIVGITGDLLSERSLKSITNKAVGHLMTGMPLEQAHNMESGSDYIERLNVLWHQTGACDHFPMWILAGAHDVVVDLANANMNTTRVGPGPDGRTVCNRCVLDQTHVRYYPFNHSNTNRRDGILGSIQNTAHPVFKDLVQILLGRSPAAGETPVGPSKLFIRLRHPACDRITGVVIDPFETALLEKESYESALADGKVSGFRQQDFVLLAGLPELLHPVSGNMVLIIKAKGERRGILPALMPYMPQIFKFERDYGPRDLVRGHSVAYRPLQVSLPPALLTTNSVLSLTLQLSESPADVPEAVTFLPGACTDTSGDPGGRRARAKESLAGKDSLDMARALRKLGATQDPAMVDLLAGFTQATFPPPLRRAAVAALGDLRARESLPALQEALQSTDAVEQALAVDALGRCPEVPAAVQLIEFLGKPANRAQERAALAGLGQVPEPILREALSRAFAAHPLAKERRRTVTLALLTGQVTSALMGLVATEAMGAMDGRTASEPYGRVLDLLVESSTPDERTWIRRMRKEAGQARDATWTRALLAKLSEHHE
jgi:pimeloyl-ACP methyl ester carboxylesterase